MMSDTKHAAFRLHPSVVVGMAVVLGVILAVGLSAETQQGWTPLQGADRNPYAWPSLEELVERSDTIVAGEILDMRSSWSVDRREIFTTVTLRPDRRFKGGERSLIRFRIPGGTVGDTRLMVTHSPAFAIGEQALVFLTGQSGRLPRVVAREAGKRHIQVGENGEQTILPGFAVSEVRSRGRIGLSTLADLSAAMPGLLAGVNAR